MLQFAPLFGIFIFTPVGLQVTHSASLRVTLACLVSLTSQRQSVFPMGNWSSRNNSTNLWHVQAFHFKRCLAWAYRSAIQDMALMAEKPTVALTTTGVLTRIYSHLDEGKYIPLYPLGFEILLERVVFFRVYCRHQVNWQS